MRIPKAVPIVLRRREGRTEVLVFAHPQAGTQIVKGTIEPGESVAQACLRELAEESGVTGTECVRDLGTWEHCPRGQVWHFREVSVSGELPETWSHFTQDGGGQVFTFRWHGLDQPAPADCHQAFVGALHFLQARLTELARHAYALDDALPQSPVGECAE